MSRGSLCNTTEGRVRMQWNASECEVSGPCSFRPALGCQADGDTCMPCRRRRMPSSGTGANDPPWVCCASLPSKAGAIQHGTIVCWCWMGWMGSPTTCNTFYSFFCLISASKCSGADFHYFAKNCEPQRKIQVDHKMLLVSQLTGNLNVLPQIFPKVQRRFLKMHYIPEALSSGLM